MPLPIQPFAWRRALLPAVACVTAGILAACGSAPQAPASIDEAPARSAPVSQPSSAAVPALPPAGSGRGGYYQDDGPGDRIPENLLATPDPDPKVEPYASRGNKPYVVFGKRYVPVLDDQPHRQRGRGSWYGKKFHGQKTSSGEIYDMYKMSAAHPTLPLPSYARVTNLSNGRQVIVRVNDRGPFHSGRIIDLSYTAALKLGYLSQGSAELEVERLLPEDIARLNAEKTDVAGTVTPAAESNQAGKAPNPMEQAVALPVVVPVVSATPIAAVVPAAAAPTASGYYLQLGAFSQAANAEGMRSQLEQKWAGVLMPTEVLANNGLYRLYSGPFSSRADAELVAQKIQEGGAGKPLIVRK